MLFYLKKDEITPFKTKVDETWGDYAKWNKKVKDHCKMVSLISEIWIFKAMAGRKQHNEKE